MAPRTMGDLRYNSSTGKWEWVANPNRIQMQRGGNPPTGPARVSRSDNQRFQRPSGRDESASTGRLVSRYKNVKAPRKVRPNY